MELRAGSLRDVASIRALLEAANLPTTDLATSSPRFVVACDSANRIVGAGALQTVGDSGLLRSVVVAPEMRGAGVGERMVQELEKVARASQVTRLALLTLTARSFFERLGYRIIERQAVPEALKDTEEFRSLCPASAICMAKMLGQT